ncbi:hypothetical protein ACDT12_13800, partial [Staphylococcus aureus]
HTNLLKWGMTRDPGCVLCGDLQSLRNVLAGCGYSPAHGRYTWIHNEVLMIVVEAARMACDETHERQLKKKECIS